MLHSRWVSGPSFCMVSILLAGCGGGSQAGLGGPGSSLGFCPITVPWVQLLYPIPGTKSVSPGVEQMVFAGTAITPIQLTEGSYPYSGELRTKLEPLPNPLPTPIATPGPYARFLTTTFAVSFRKLKPHTRYGAQAWEKFNAVACNAGTLPVPPGWGEIASFSA